MTSHLATAAPRGAAAPPSEFWNSLRSASAKRPTPPAQGSVMEAGLHILNELSVAPPRTLHSAPLIASSPLSPPVRAMFEAREFGRRFDSIPLDVASVEKRLPQLLAPEGDVEFLADDHALEDLSLSVDGLLQHRKRLLASSIHHQRQRRHVLVLGAGPAGLMAAVQLALRDHHVVICEAREVYSRNRYIGVYKEVTHLMAALGMPESMTYDFSQYRGKRGIMLADIQTLLHGIALKLGVVIYTGAVGQSLDIETLRSGEVHLQRAPGRGFQSPTVVGITRWHHDSVARVSSGVTIRFDLVLDATGGRGGVRETLVGKENVVPLREIGKMAAKEDSSLASYFDDPEDHCAEYVESGYGCPPGLRPAFADALTASQDEEIPNQIPCFVSNIDASIFKEPMRQTENSLGLASRIGNRDLKIPHDWVVLECRVSDQRLSRYHIEGPLPQTFDFGGQSHSTHTVLHNLNPVSFLLRILYAMGVPFDAVDRRQLVDFYAAESSQTDASDIVGTWLGQFRGLRVGGKDPIWCGKVPGSESIDYGILGESLQNAWYRFGVGVDDAFTSANYFAVGLESSSEERLVQARRLERIMRSRAVQILYHLFSVARNKDQGVVGSVLTEYQMEEQHSENLAEARLREMARQAAEMSVVHEEVLNNGSEVLNAALNFVRSSYCERIIEVLKCFRYPSGVLADASNAIINNRSKWAHRVHGILDDILSPSHRVLLTPLLKSPERTPRGSDHESEERLNELAAGRYQWVTPWLRACALRAIDPSTPRGGATLSAAAGEPDRMLAEVAHTALGSAISTLSRDPQTKRCITFDRVLILKTVRLFVGIPHELLANVALLMTERLVAPEEPIIQKGDHGDSLYVIVEGRVRVHDGDRELRKLARNDFFGELALLDAEPRTASVTAIEPTFLLRLAQDDFYALMRDQGEIVREINRALCKIIRNT